MCTRKWYEVYIEDYAGGTAIKMFICKKEKELMLGAPFLLMNWIQKNLLDCPFLAVIEVILGSKKHQFKC